jgi:hypothetical protein
MDIIHRTFFRLKHSTSETDFCLRLQVVPTQLSPIDRASWTQLSMYHLRTETESGLRSDAF